ncbi:MAG: acyl-CoA thioesterase [Desulfobacterales bacterium]|nr:acyl-CoA thioesterase [Desulfobacterales bacterium]
MADFEVFLTDIELRFRDVDAMGHVNNAVYFTYFEYGRIKFFYSEDQKEKFPGFSFILAHVSCDFIRPVTLDDRVTLRMWIKAIGSKSFTLNYQLVDAADPAVIFAVGDSVQVCFDYQKNTSVAISKALHAQLSAYLEK